jgi:hypothetical protein
MQRISLGGEWVLIEETTGEFAVKSASWDVLDALFNRTDNVPYQAYAQYTPRRSLPRSCIESAEFAIQLSHDPGLRWKPDEERTPNVQAHFGGGTTLNITTSTSLADDVTGLTSYPFTTLPRVGEGVIIANRTRKDLPFNIHVGAVVARHKTKEACILTDLVESGNVKLIMPWSIKLVTGSVDGFRGSDYQGKSYALGYLK